MQEQIVAIVSEILTEEPLSLENILVDFQKRGEEDLPGYITLEGTHYMYSGKEILELKERVGFYSFLFRPLESHVGFRCYDNRRATLYILRCLAPYRAIDEEELPDIELHEPESLQDSRNPYLQKLYRRGKVKIKGTEHLGSLRGLDATNVLRREILTFIQSSLPKAFSPFQKDLLRHKVNGSSTELYFPDKVVHQLFREICDLYLKELT